MRVEELKVGRLPDHVEPRRVRDGPGVLGPSGGQGREATSHDQRAAHGQFSSMSWGRRAPPGSLLKSMTKFGSCFIRPSGPIWTSVN